MWKRIGRLGLMLIAVALVFANQPTDGHESPLHRVNANMAKMTSSFLDALSDDLREKATFAFDGPERTDWHFIPKERLGVTLKEMNLEQRRAAHRLMKNALSVKGYLKATTIMSLEQILRVLEADRPGTIERRDQEKYWFAVFGEPGAEKPWGWRVEGHHLSINFSSVSGVIVSSTPFFLGANPAEVRTGPRTGLRVLGDEEDIGRRIMRTLDREQRKVALIDTEAPADVITVPGHEIDLGAPAGIALDEMPAGKRRQVFALIRELVSNLRGELAAAEMKTIRESDAGKIHFAWAGSLRPGEGHYYRIHGSTFIIEYDNTQNEANHAHIVWHSMTNDFGLDTLKNHHAEQHAGAASE
jgi:hypothetical protein